MAKGCLETVSVLNCTLGAAGGAVLGKFPGARVSSISSSLFLSLAEAASLSRLALSSISSNSFSTASSASNLSRSNRFVVGVVVLLALGPIVAWLSLCWKLVGWFGLALESLSQSAVPEEGRGISVSVGSSAFNSVCVIVNRFSARLPCPFSSASISVLTTVATVGWGGGGAFPIAVTSGVWELASSDDIGEKKGKGRIRVGGRRLEKKEFVSLGGRSRKGKSGDLLLWSLCVADLTRSRNQYSTPKTTVGWKSRDKVNLKSDAFLRRRREVAEDLVCPLAHCQLARLAVS